MARVFVSGEALIDFVPAETRDGERAFVPKPGGSLMNVAKAAAKAGATTEFVGVLSDDFLGEMLRADLEASGAGTALSARSERPSPLAFVDLSTGSPRYAFHFEGTAEADMAPAIEATPLPGDVLHVGSIALVGPAAGRIMDFALAEAGRRMLSLDPNARETLIRDRAAWAADIERLTRAAAILKLSDEDLASLDPGATPDDFARAALERGPDLVVVTGGAEGATAYTRAGRASVRAPRIELVDAVGAGDTLMGSTLAWLVAEGVADRAALAALDDDRLTALLRFATAAAALNCTRAGCVPPSRAEVEAFLAER